KLDQLQEFLNDKNNVVMSSYKTDTKTGLPVKYLKDTKEALWENFSYQLPNSMKRTTFMKLLQGKQYIYQENLGGLCSTCSRYGYEVFAEISQFVKTNIQDSNIQKNYINEFEYLQRYFKKIYEQKFEISIYGVPIHNACISHCLLYAFGVCKEIHNYECNEYSQLFKVFYQLKEDTPITLHNEIDEYHISTPSIPKNPWTISLPNDTGFNIKEQLETRGILKDININRKELVKKLELVLAEETLEKTLECSSLSNQVQNLSENERLNKNSNVSSSSQVINAQNKPRGKKKILKEYKFTIFLWPLASRWALKSSQKYGKKGCGKRISKKLKQCVENGVIEKDEVPKLETIQN
ncbi:7253_t:CDS:2, partial [Gigaspora rosea]